MKALFAGFGLSLFLAAGTVWAAQLPMEEVAEGVYVHAGKHGDFDEHYQGDMANIGFVVGSQGVAIIDTGGSYKVGSALREAVKSVTDLPIRYVINTHIHPDHIFGNAAFVQDKPEFIGHHNLPGTMELNRESLKRSLQQVLGAEAEGSEIIPPTWTVKDALDIDLGNRKLHLQAWPKSHTNTDLTVLDEKTQTFWTGDLLFIIKTPSLDGDLKGWITVIDGLKAVQAKMTIPGHGDSTKDKNGALDRQAAYLNLLLKDIRAAIKQGVQLTEAIDTAAQAEKPNWVLFELVNRRNVNQAYPQLEWE
jgi:quinoprotein relay system zinc metallohydrolase 2